MAGLAKVLASLTPPPFVNPEEYDGLEVAVLSFYCLTISPHVVSLEVVRFQAST
jgi:hypothetical protein